MAQLGPDGLSDAPDPAPRQAVPPPVPPELLRLAMGKGLEGSLARDCFTSFVFPFLKMNELVGMSLRLIGSMAIASLASAGVLICIRPQTPDYLYYILGTAIAIVVAILLLIGGYFLEYLFSTARAAKDNPLMAPVIPRWSTYRQLKNILKMTGIYLVYNLPLVTAPLLPLGLMAMAAGRDDLAFDLP